jgi:protein TonB
MQSEAETATTASTLPAQAASAAATESEPSVRVTRDARFLTSPRPPAYPERAVALGLEGEVIVRAFVAAPGRPGEVIVHESSGHRWLDEAALAAVERWQFAPPLIDGRETAAWVEIPIPFTLR